MHEAFAAQVLSNLQGFESREWAERAGFSEPVGEVDRARLNVMGGSIAIGHPFGATGARITTTLCNELGRRGGQFGLMTVCAAGLTLDLPGESVNKFSRAVRDELSAAFDRIEHDSAVRAAVLISGKTDV